jgi:hypothetical protein
LRDICSVGSKLVFRLWLEQVCSFRPPTSFSRAGRIHRQLERYVSRIYATEQTKAFKEVRVYSHIAIWVAARFKQRSRPRELLTKGTRHSSIASTYVEGSIASSEPGNHATVFLNHRSLAVHHRGKQCAMPSFKAYRCRLQAKPALHTSYQLTVSQYLALEENSRYHNGRWRTRYHAS